MGTMLAGSPWRTAPVISSTKSLRVAQWNVCGFRSRKEQCQNLAKDYALDVLCLQVLSPLIWVTCVPKVRDS
eukprot:5970071-Amphidinium_carterae.1